MTSNNITTIRQFFDFLNKECDYLVLRNWDDIFDEGIYGSGHEDIDILCRDLDSFIALTNAKRVHSSEFRDNFFVKIGKMNVRFDVRHVGDGYYPLKWEDSMLNNKVLTEQNIYIMGLPDYAYSLSYHALIQKPTLSDEYKKKVINALQRLDEHKVDFQDSDILKMLQSFCIRNNYVIETPSDPGVYLNKKNISEFEYSRNYRRCLRRMKLRLTQLINSQLDHIKK